MLNIIVECLSRFGDFQSRAGRTEYWTFSISQLVFLVLLSLAFGLLAGAFGGSDGGIVEIAGLVVIGGASLILLLPSIAVAVRRLHDHGRSAWWLLVIFVPLLGFIGFLILMLLPGDAESNRYGPPPEEATSA